MSKRPFLAAFLALGLAPFLAPSATAQEFGARYSKRFDNGSLTVSVGTGDVCRPSTSYGRRPIRSSSYYGKRRGWGRTWIPGRYEVVSRQVWVPGYSERVWVEPIYDVSYDSCGNRVSVMVSAGHYQTVRRPGHYETRREKVWRPGYWGRR